MSSESWAATQDAFAEAANWFVHSAPAGRGRWDEVALGEWTVRDLVGHTSRALQTVETYLTTQSTAVDVASSVEYFRLALASSGDAAAVAQRGRDAGTALGPDPTEAVAAIASRVLATVRGADGNAPVATPVGGMRLIDYLPTRTFELTVHTCDLAVALDQVVEVPEAAGSESLKLLGELAVRAGRTGPLLLAATGRRALPDGFTVL